MLKTRLLSLLTKQTKDKAELNLPKITPVITQISFKRKKVPF